MISSKSLGLCGFPGLCGVTVPTSQVRKLGLKDVLDGQSYLDSIWHSLNLFVQVQSLCFFFRCVPLPFTKFTVWPWTSVFSSVPQFPFLESKWVGWIDAQSQKTILASPSCRPSPAWVETKGKRNALEPGNHKLIRIHLLPLTSPVPPWTSAWQCLPFKIYSLYVLLV